MLWIKVFSQLSIVVIIMFNIVIAGLYYVFKYDSGKSIEIEIHNIRKQQKKIQIKNKKLNKKINDFKSIHNLTNQLGEKINSIVNYIPNKITDATILKHLNTESKKAGVSIENIRNQGVIDASEADFYKKIKIHVTVKGGFSQVMIFLSALTGLPIMLIIENFTIKQVTQKVKSVHSFNQEIIMDMDMYGYKYTDSIIKKSEKKTVKE